MASVQLLGLIGMVEVKPGTTWADNSGRGRTVRVVRVDARYAYCTILTNREAAQAELDKGSPWARDMRGKETRILLGAFRDGPAKRGYSPVEGGDGD